jgi:hypothetical protein
MSEISKARREALANFDKREGKFNRTLRRAIDKLKLDPAEADFLRLLTTANIVGYLDWSNRTIRRAAAKALIDVFLSEFAKHPRRRRWLGTFCWDGGITWERRPRADLIGMRVAVWKALDGYGLTGIGVVEVDVLKQRRRAPGRRLLVHIHVVVEERQGIKFRPKKAAAKLSGSRRFRNRLGARSVKFDRITAAAADWARIAAYLCKFPPSAKNMIPSRARPGKHVFRPCKMAPASALRLVEVMSLVRATDVVFGIGEKGKRLRKSWNRRFKKLLGKRHGRSSHMAKDYPVKREWASIRSRNGSKRLKPCRIISRARDRE